MTTNQTPWEVPSDGPDFGYLQHSAGPQGPFRTEMVKVRYQFPGRWWAYFEGRWRAVYIQRDRVYITYRGERITIQIKGV